MTRFFFRILKMSVKAALLVSVVAILVAYARLANMDGLKEAFEAHVLEKTGRRLTVNGDIGLDMAFPPRLMAENVSLENPSWGSRKNMMTVNKIEAEVDLLPLIKGEVMTPKLRLIGVDVLLETNKKGENNWDGLADLNSSVDPMKAMSLTGILLGVGAIAVVGGIIAYASAATGKVVSLPLPGTDVVFGGDGGSSPIFNPGC